MNWKFFIGASIIVAGALARFAPASAIASGLVLAMVLNWIKLRGSARKLH